MALGRPQATRARWHLPLFGTSLLGATQAGASLLGTLLAGQALAPPMPATAPASAAPPAYERVVLGLCEDYPLESRSIAQARRDLHAARAAGAKVLRVALAWDNVEPAPGTYDLAFWDEFVRIATDECHLRLIPYVCYTPRWCATSTDDATFWRSVPREPEAFGRLMKMLAARYKGRIGSWELWNEPDNRDFWLGTPAQYAALVRAGAAGVRAGNPHASVVLGGIAWNNGFLKTLFADEHIADDVDVVNLHAYCETWAPESLEDIYDHLLTASDIVEQYGNGQRLWLAEVGYSDQRHGGTVSAQYEARYAYEHTRDFQAEALFRLETLAVATQKVDLVAWYRINDLPAAQRVIGDGNNRHLGVLTVDGAPKPAYHALEFFSSLFDQPVRCIDTAVRVTRAIRSAARVHAFERADGSIVVAGWLEHAAPGRGRGMPEGASGAGPAETVALQIPLSRPALITVFDVTGRPLGTVDAAHVGDVLTIPKLTLEGPRTTVLLIEPAGT